MVTPKPNVVAPAAAVVADSNASPVTDVGIATAFANDPVGLPTTLFAATCWNFAYVTTLLAIVVLRATLPEPLKLTVGDVTSPAPRLKFRGFSKVVAVDAFPVTVPSILALKVSMTIEGSLKLILVEDKTSAVRPEKSVHFLSVKSLIKPVCLDDKGGDWVYAPVKPISTVSPILPSAKKIIGSFTIKLLVFTYAADPVIVKLPPTLRSPIVNKLVNLPVEAVKAPIAVLLIFDATVGLIVTEPFGLNVTFPLASSVVNLPDALTVSPMAMSSIVPSEPELIVVTPVPVAAPMFTF